VTVALQVDSISVSEAWDGRAKTSRAYLLFADKKDAASFMDSANLEGMDNGRALIVKPAEANDASLTSSLEAQFVMIYCAGDYDMTHE